MMSYFWASLRFIINIILVAVLGYEATKMGLTFNKVRPLRTSPIAIAVDKVNVQTKSSSMSFDIAPLLTARLFGQLSDEVVSSTTSPPDSPLDLKLQGIYYSVNQQLSYAIVTNNSGKATLYRRGDTIDHSSQNQIIIQEIDPKQIVLLRNHRQEIIRLSTPPTTSANNSLPATTSPNTNPESNATESTNHSMNSNMSPEQLLGYYQQQLQSDPATLSQLVRINPVNEGERLIGYRLRPGQDATLMARFGLQAGDIVTAINGVTLDSPMKALGLVQQLATTDQLNVQLLRDGKSESLSFSVRK